MNDVRETYAQKQQRIRADQEAQQIAEYEAIIAQKQLASAARRAKEEQDRIESEQQAAADKADREAHEANRRKRISEQRSSIKYSDKLANEICERIAVGELLINICDEENMPTHRMVMAWLKNEENKDFYELYSIAEDDRLSVFAEEVVAIADDSRNDYVERMDKKTGELMRVLDQEAITRSRLRMDVRFKHLKAGRPDKWGDSPDMARAIKETVTPTHFTVNVITANSNDNPTIQTIDMSSQAQVEKQQIRLAAK